MAEKETGWTRQWPEVAGYYWQRIAAYDAPILVHIVGDTCRFRDGSSEGRHECYEFLGPISPSDAEQLMELRKTGTRMLEVLETYKERHLVPAYLLNALVDLRDALAGVDRTVTVQCADCLAWFDKNSNHTCGKQVRANRRYSGGSHV